MVYQAIEPAVVATPGGHLQGIEGQVRAHRRVEPSSDDSPGENTEHKRGVHLTRPGGIAVTSATHKALGRCAMNCRSTRSAGRAAAAGSGRVVRGRAAAQGTDKPSGAHKPL
jgi:hypothetical protein